MRGMADAPTLPLPIHACLNALGRLAAALSHDERAQDGLERLADCLTASQRVALQPPVQRLPAVCEAMQAQWQLKAWLDQVPASLDWQAQGSALATAGIVPLAEGLWAALQALRPPPGGRVLLQVDLHDDTAAGLQHARAVVTAVPAGASPALHWHWPLESSSLKAGS